VKTVVIFFEKGTRTRKVWYYQLDPGRSLGKTNPLNDADLSDFIDRQKDFADSAKSWSVDVKDIDTTTWDLSVKNPNGGGEVQHRSPQAILEEIAVLDAESAEVLGNIRGMSCQSAFSQRGPGWVEKSLEQATGGVFTGPFGSLLHKHDYIENGIPLVNPAHITDTGIEPDMSKTVSEATAKRLENYIMRAGDVVIGRRGEMGRCALVTEAEDGWLCGTGSFFIRPSDRCDMGYLVHYLRSEGCRKQLEALAGGAVMPNLSNTALSGLPLFLPPRREQKKIVKELDALSTETQRLAALYERKLAALEELKKSLLHQAFSGAL
jgi:type I restriction enzyme, S subunit